MKFLALLAVLTASSAQSGDIRAPIYGLWGTDAQCQAALISPTGTRRAVPFELRPGWLRQGDMWCRLSWFPTTPRATGLFAPARALCGEDSARGYRLDIVLSDETIMLIWDESLTNGPLHRCPNM